MYIVRHLLLVPGIKSRYLIWLHEEKEFWMDAKIFYSFLSEDGGSFFEGV